MNSSGCVFHKHYHYCVIISYQICDLLQHLCDCQLQHRVEAIVKFAHQYTSDLRVVCGVITACVCACVCCVCVLCVCVCVCVLCVCCVCVCVLCCVVCVCVCVCVCCVSLHYVMSFNRSKRQDLTKGMDYFYQRNLGLPQKNRLAQYLTMKVLSE